MKFYPIAQAMIRNAAGDGDWWHDQKFNCSSDANCSVNPAEPQYTDYDVLKDSMR